MQWEKLSKDKEPDDCIRNDSILFWKDHKIQIKIHSCWGHGPGGFRTHYEFIVNGESYPYRMIDSYIKGIIVTFDF